MFSYKAFGVISFAVFIVADTGDNCRVRSSYTRQDGGECFEIPRWQYQEVELEQHLSGVRKRFEVPRQNSALRSKDSDTKTVIVNSEISRYMDTVIAQFLDTYHRNIQTAYQQLTDKLLRRIKEELNIAVKRKQKIYKKLITLADDLNVPEFCDEERRAARTIASRHVAQIYECTKGARDAISKMGKYAEDMINITRNHMQEIVNDAQQGFVLSGKVFKKSKVTSCLRGLSQAAVNLGYELDISLTNARRHNEQSCERLTSCVMKMRIRTEEDVKALSDEIYQCVYA